MKRNRFFIIALGVVIAVALVAWALFSSAYTTKVWQLPAGFNRTVVVEATYLDGTSKVAQLACGKGVSRIIQDKLKGSGSTSVDDHRMLVEAVFEGLADGEVELPAKCAGLDVAKLQLLDIKEGTPAWVGKAAGAARNFLNER